jgi:hypothetical protein
MDHGEGREGVAQPYVQKSEATLVLWRKTEEEKNKKNTKKWSWRLKGNKRVREKILCRIRLWCWKTSVLMLVSRVTVHDKEKGNEKVVGMACQTSSLCLSKKKKKSYCGSKLNTQEWFIWVPQIKAKLHDFSYNHFQNAC